MRKGVGIIVLNKNNYVFVGKEKTIQETRAMPQGGVDEGEDY